MSRITTDSRHYSDIAGAIRSKSGSSGTYRPEEMASAIMALEGSGGSTILVYAETGSAVSLILGETVQTTSEVSGLWQFAGCGPGSYEIRASKEGMERSYTVDILEEDQRLRYIVEVVYQNIYGVARDITTASSAWTRTDLGVDMTATASVGTEAGSSDFSNIYPWSGIARQTLSTGDVMVRIPKFWYRRFYEGTVEHIQITDSAADQFKLHPAFCHGGVERDCVYVGAYKTSTGNCSASGAAPLISKKRSECRTLARSKGTGWGLIDLSTLSAIQMLYLVEFADYNSQAMIGRGITDKQAAGGSVASSGAANDVANLTGRASGTDGVVEMVYRGMEGLWGNGYEYLDGIIMDCTNHAYCVCNDPDVYTDTLTANYTSMAYPVAAPGVLTQYVTKLGLEAGERDYIMLPEEAEGGSGSTYVCDTISSLNSGVSILKYGGRWWAGDVSGLFSIEGSNVASDAYIHSCSRLIYIPQE